MSEPVFGKLEAYAVIACTALAVAVFPVFGAAMDTVYGHWKKYRPSVFPTWLLRWAILPATIVCACYGVTLYYFVEVTTFQAAAAPYHPGPDSWQLIAGLVLLIAHMAMFKMWTINMTMTSTRVTMRWPMSIFQLLLFVGITGGFYACMIAGQTGLFWVPIITFSILTLFIMMASILHTITVFTEYSEWREANPAPTTRRKKSSKERV